MGKGFSGIRAYRNADFSYDYIRHGIMRPHFYGPQAIPQLTAYQEDEAKQFLSDRGWLNPAVEQQAMLADTNR